MGTCAGSARKPGHSWSSLYRSPHCTDRLMVEKLLVHGATGLNEACIRVNEHSLLSSLGGDRRSIAARERRVRTFSCSSNAGIPVSLSTAVAASGQIPSYHALGEAHGILVKYRSPHTVSRDPSPCTMLAVYQGTDAFDFLAAEKITPVASRSRDPLSLSHGVYKSFVSPSIVAHCAPFPRSRGVS